LFFIVVLTASSAPPYGVRDLRNEELLVPTLVVLNVDEHSLGTGVIIDRMDNTYWVLTADHVVTGKGPLDVVFKKGGPRYTARRIALDANKDLALLLVKIPDKSITPAHFCNTEPSTFDYVVAVGSGLGHPIFATEGWIANTDLRLEDVPEVRHLHHTAPIAPGNSGGPLFKLEDDHYCITGINVRGIPGFSQFGIAVHLNEILSFVNQ
jgi:S1-C subfamily serine protease